jgi:hypothetical protein
MEGESEDTETPFYKSKHYYDLGDAYFDLAGSSGLKEGSKAAAKLAGKSVFNLGLLTGKAAVELAKHTPEIMKKVNERLQEEAAKKNVK